MKIGKTIKQLRRERDMTQEALAERLNISISAVSQWEIDKTMPDITMLPLLSAIFNVSTDELLGIKGEKAQQQINEYLKKADENYRANKLKDAISIMETAYEEFPTNISIIDQYTFYLKEKFGRFGVTDSALVDKCIKLNTYILENSLDDVIRQHAISRMCTCYSLKSDKETALKYANQLPRNFQLCAPYIIKRDNLLPDDKKIAVYRENIYALAGLLDSFILSLANPENQNSASTLKNEERIDILKQRIDVLNAIFADKLLEKNYEIYDTHRMIALLYLDIDNCESAIEHLKQAYNYALKFKTDFCEGDCYCSPILFDYKAKPTVSQYNNGSDSAIVDFYKRLTLHGFYKPLENNPSFIALKEQLAKHISG